jgi:hypothetical protein
LLASQCESRNTRTSPRAKLAPRILAATIPSRRGDLNKWTFGRYCRYSSSFDPKCSDAESKMKNKSDGGQLASRYTTRPWIRHFWVAKMIEWGKFVFNKTKLIWISDFRANYTQPCNVSATNLSELTKALFSITTVIYQYNLLEECWRWSR